MTKLKNNQNKLMDFLQSLDLALHGALATYAVVWLAEQKIKTNNKTTNDKTTKLSPSTNSTRGTDNDRDYDNRGLTSFTTKRIRGL